MSGKRCPMCGSVVFGRSDKKYCSSTCRRQACRVRSRVVRLGDYEYFGSELNFDSVETVLLGQLEREHGPHHRIVHQARRDLEAIREERQKAQREELEPVMRRLSFFTDPELNALLERLRNSKDESDEA